MRRLHCNVCDRFCEDFDPYACVHFCCTSPLVIDLDNNGFQFELANPNGVVFNMSGTPEAMLWVAPGYRDTFLAYDLNANGRIDNGQELFGQGTQLWLSGIRDINGFVTLAQYDDPRLGGNDDGVISAADAFSANCSSGWITTPMHFASQAKPSLSPLPKSTVWASSPEWDQPSTSSATPSSAGPGPHLSRRLSFTSKWSTSYSNPSEPFHSAFGAFFTSSHQSKAMELTSRAALHPGPLQLQYQKLLSLVNEQLGPGHPPC